MLLKRIARDFARFGRRLLASHLALSLAVGGVATPTTAQAPTVATDSERVGQSVTLLPDGRWLVLGGESPSGATGSAALWDARTGAFTALATGLSHARAWHSATMLADGRVLIFGGRGADGRLVRATEVYDPATQRFDVLGDLSVEPRAAHTATLLTDGTVLIAGGISTTGVLLDEAEIWDPAGQDAIAVPSRLTSARQRHRATLMPDGTVMLWGGIDDAGLALSNGEHFDPAALRFNPLTTPLPEAEPGPIAPHLGGSWPTDGADGVPVDSEIALRFSKPLRAETLSVGSVTLSGPRGPELITIVVAESGRLAFLHPDSSLVPGERYIVSVSGPSDVDGFLLEPAAISFRTASKRGGTSSGEREISSPMPSQGREPLGQTDGSATTPDENDEEWSPGRAGDWRTGRKESAWQSLPALQAPPGTTALAGQVLCLNGNPLVNVTLRIGTTETRTDSTGRFLLTGVVEGVYELVIEGRTANTPGESYGRFMANIELKPGLTTVLPYTIWMPRLDNQHAVKIPAYSTTEVVVTTPRIPGLELRIPAHAAIKDEDGNAVTEVTITPIPLDRPPFPLPAGVQVPLYFTIQPGGAYVYARDGGGARLIYPNSLGRPARQKFEFWDYDAERKGWYIYGLGTVTDDGRQVVPDPGVAIYEFSGAMVADPTDAPAQGPPSGTSGRGSTQVDLATGLFVYQKTDFYLRDVLPIVLTRTYRPQDSRSRAFGIGATHPYEMFLVGNSNPYTWIDLVLADGGRVHFDRISAGTGYADAVFEHTSSPSAFYKAQVSWNGAGWDLRLKNGTVYVFANGVGTPLVAIRDRNGNTITVARASGTTGPVTWIATPNGRRLEFTYDASSRITQIKDMIGRTATYAYDGSGRLASVTDQAGGVTQYTYDPSHRMLTLRDPRGILFLTNEYNADGRATRQTRADSTTYQFAYTVDGGTGRITQCDVTNPRGYVRRVTFTSAGYVAASTRAFGTAIQQTTTYERQLGTNFITAIVDALGRRQEHTYDAMGNLLTITRLAGSPDATTTALTYEPIFNQVVTATDPLGHTTTFSYDSNGNVLTVQDPLGNITTLTYNTAGQVLTRRLPGDTMSTTYTYQFGDVVSITDPLGDEKRRFVDAAGRTVSVRDPLGRQRVYDWDALDRLVRFTDPLGNASAMAYDANDNLRSLTDAVRPIGGTMASGVTAWAPDTMDRLDTRTDPLGRSDHPAYDAAGNLTTFTDRKGQVTALTYDALNRPMLTTYHDGSTTTYAWDAGNRLTQVADSISGTITRAYDSFDRLIQELTPQGGLTYTYDAAGRRTSMTVAGQLPVSYSYDGGNRLTQITQGNSVTTFEYDVAGRRTLLTLPNGVNTEYMYDAASRLTGLTYKRGGTVLGTLGYAYDAAGKRTQTTGTWARTSLPSVVESATYSGANQQLTSGNSSLTYDLNGSVLTNGDTTYTWDARGRLAAIEAPGLSASFQYDPFGRRTQKTINGVTTAFLYDVRTPIQEQKVAATANLLTGLGIDEYLTRTDSEGRRVFLTDGVGSTIALTDDTGTVVTEYTYDPFGTTTATGAVNANIFQYTSRENDGATGLYYYRARYYSPSLHRFISEDRLEIDAWDANLYAYVGNDPVSFVDPSGTAAALAAPMPRPLPGYAGVVEVGMTALVALLFYFLAMIFAQMDAASGSGAAAGSGAGEGAGAGAGGGPPPDADGAGKDGGAGGGAGSGTGTPTTPDPGIPWPGSDPAKAPPGFPWRGRPGSQPGGKDGNYHNPTTGESLRPDLDHPAPVKPHWDYKDPSGNWWRWYEDGTFDPK